MPAKALGASTRLALRRLGRSRRDRPSLYFAPSPGFLKFWNDDSRRVCLIAANRTGKTRHAIERLARKMRETPNLRCRIVAPTNRMANRVHGRYLAEALGADRDEGSHWNMKTGWNGGNIAMSRNGSSCQITSYEQDPDAHAGDDLDLVLLDEPPPPAHYEEALARVFSREGIVWVGLTAVGRPSKWLKLIVEEGVQEGDWTIHPVALSVANCPWYSPEQVARRIKEARRSPWSYAQRIEGAWEGVSDDRRFTGLTENTILPLSVGVKQRWPEAGKRVQLVLSVDHGTGSGHAVWVLLGYQVRSGQAATGERRVYVRALAEWSNSHAKHSPRSEATAVRDMLKDHGVALKDIAWGVGDTNAMSKSETARTMNQAFEQEFAKLMGCDPEQPRLRIRPAKKGPDSVEAGIACVNGLMSEGDLEISEVCGRVVDAARHWAGKDDELVHAADALRYGCRAVVAEAGHSPVRLVAD